MKAPRALVLVSNDPVSVERGSEEVFRTLQAEIRAHGLMDEIKVSTIGSVGEQDDLPLVIIYPEGVVYGPVRTEDVQLLVVEHLIQGHIVRSLVGTHARIGGRDRLVAGPLGRVARPTARCAGTCRTR